MGVIRAFIAIDLSSEIQQQIDELVRNYKAQLVNIPIRWASSTSVHLTIKFLGDVSLSNLDILTGMIQSEVSGHHQFEISVGSTGAFPNIHQPRIIWVGVEAPPELTSVQNSIEVATARLGYPREEKAFSPHLTIGRVSRNVSSQEVKTISKVLETTKIGFLGATNVEKIHLYKSDLQPYGAVYTQIYSVYLKKI